MSFPQTPRSAKSPRLLIIPAGMGEPPQSLAQEGSIKIPAMLPTGGDGMPATSALFIKSIMSPEHLVGVGGDSQFRRAQFNTQPQHSVFSKHLMWLSKDPSTSLAGGGKSFDPCACQWDAQIGHQGREVPPRQGKPPVSSTPVSTNASQA